MKKPLLAIALFGCLSAFSFAQPDPCPFFDKADSLYQAEDLLAAQGMYHQALYAAIRAKDWPCAQQSLYHFADLTYDLRDNRGAIDTLQRWIPFLEKQKGMDPFLQARLYLAVSFNEARLENNQGQLDALERAIDIFESIDTLHVNVAYAYKNAGQILEMRLNYPKAIAYFEKALENDTIHKYTAEVYSYLSDCYYWQEDYYNAEVHLQKGLLEKPSDPKDAAMLALSGAGLYLKKGDYEKAESFARQGLEILKKNPGERIGPGPVYSTLAEVLHVRNKTGEAAKYWDLAVEASRKTYPEKNREHAKMLVNAGDFYVATGMPDKALSLYQQAIVQVYPGFNSLDPKDNPAPDFAFVESWAMTAPARKAQLLTRRFESTRDAGLLLNAAACYDLALRQVGLLKTTYGTDAAKVYMSGYSYSYFEEAIAVQATLYEKTGDMSHLDRIYRLMEESKADVLREAVDRNRSLMQGMFPDSLLRREEALRFSIADLRTLLLEEQFQEGEKDEAALGIYRTRLGDLERDYEKILFALKKYDPRFEGAGQVFSASSLDEVKRMLAAENAFLLEYFHGEKTVYALCVHPGGAILHTLPDQSSLTAAIQRFGNYFREADASLSDPAGYFAAAHDLYTLLIPKEAAPLFDKFKKLIAIPDGPLGYLPFEALLTAPYSGKSFGQAPYLINKLPVQYSWSAELLWRSGTEKGKGAVVQFDPMFAKGERGLAPLTLGKRETASLGRFRRMTGAAAGLAEFQHWAPKSLILHLSTHASARAGAEPRVEFFDQALTLPQLYALLLPADLVVLSACETNLGEIAAGEGIMSLARGFAYAGAGSLVAAQWEINESSTAQILAQFYKSLSGEQPKLEALRGAKLHFLENAPGAAFQSPYYWAGLSYYGEDGVVGLPASFPVWGWGVVVFFLVLLGFWLVGRYGAQSAH